MSNLIGLMWTNGADEDILEETLGEAIKNFDTTYIAITPEAKGEKSWQIARSLQVRYPGKIEHIQRESERNDRAQRNSLLKKIREKYKPEDTWCHVIESDTFFLETDPREAIKKFSKFDLACTYHMLNACRKPGTWDKEDKWPNWDKPIREIMTYCHWMEIILYAWRPLPKLYFDPNTFKPWPCGFSKYVKNNQGVKAISRVSDAPLVLHCGIRGPTFLYNKFKYMGPRHRKYASWDLRSPETIEKTCSFFQEWAAKAHPANREEWSKWITTKKEIQV